MNLHDGSDTVCPTVMAGVLHTFISSVLGAVGMGLHDAETVARIMADADLYGADAHGVFRLPSYVRRIRAGGMNLTPDIKVLSERSSTALLDGDNAMGHLVMRRAADLAIEKARKTGVAWVGARMSNHAGPAGLYARMPLAHGMVGIYIAVGSANHLPPWGGVEMLLSTNPIAIAVPAAERSPIVLDMATTNAAYGKVKAKALAGEMMPEGWMVDRDGRPLLDPKRASEGFLLPIGGPKGYGLALMFGLMAGTLNGAAFGRDVIDFNADFKSTTNTGHLIVAVDVEAFMPLAQFTGAVDEIWSQMQGAERLQGVDAIRLPGEQSQAKFAQRTRDGVPMSIELRNVLDALADDVGATRLA